VIFVTVGTQLPFDRLIKAIDQWCLKNPEEEVFAQIGPSNFLPQNMRFSDFITPSEVEEYSKKSDLIIAHAGMGSVLTALRFQKPVMIVPRQASYDEHRNDHQLATAKWLQSLDGITVAWDEKEAVAFLMNKQHFVSGSQISEDAEDRLIDFIKKIIKQA
jgi:UDP-N-acetylglucosamine transferase subunit ALG13